MDLLVTSLVVAQIVTESFRSIFNDALSLGVDNLSDILLPYLLGKYLIEQKGLRFETARRFVTLLFFVAVVSPYEFVSGRNPFHNLFYRFFEQSAWTDNRRWGFWRIGGPFGGAELTGCIFLCAIILQIWLKSTGYWERRPRWLPVSGDAGVIVLLGLAAGSFMTISRGPWMAMLFALPISLIGFTRNVIRSLLAVGVVSILVGSILYSVIDKYTDTSWERVESIDQQNAFYRRQLMTAYSGVIEQGGLWGWGRANRPRVGNLDSIDNEFLLVELSFGKIGLTLFVTIIGWSSVRLVHAAISNRRGRRRDMQFQFALLGAIIGVAVAVTTVYMGLQVKPVFFLMIGWAEGTMIFRAVQSKATMPNPSRPSSFALGQLLK
jgi:hypothetical protein